MEDTEARLMVEKLKDLRVLASSPLAGEEAGGYVINILTKIN